MTLHHSNSLPPADDDGGSSVNDCGYYASWQNMDEDGMPNASSLYGVDGGYGLDFGEMRIAHPRNEDIQSSRAYTKANGGDISVAKEG